MSDKLIVEFYESDDSVIPTACVLACHGGDNPASAATTLADFFEELSSLRDPGHIDAGLLASRFVVFESSKGSGSSHLDFNDVSIVPFQQKYGYQTVRVFARKGRAYVHCVKDKWTSAKELLDAAIILQQEGVDPPLGLMNLG